MSSHPPSIVDCHSGESYTVLCPFRLTSIGDVTVISADKMSLCFSGFYTLRPIQFPVLYNGNTGNSIVRVQEHLTNVQPSAPVVTSSEVSSDTNLILDYSLNQQLPSLSPLHGTTAEDDEVPTSSLSSRISSRPSSSSSSSTTSSSSSTTSSSGGISTRRVTVVPRKRTVSPVTRVRAANSSNGKKLPGYLSPTLRDRKVLTSLETGIRGPCRTIYLERHDRDTRKKIITDLFYDMGSDLCPFIMKRVGNGRQKGETCNRPSSGGLCKDHRGGLNRRTARGQHYFLDYLNQLICVDLDN